MIAVAGKLRLYAPLHIGVLTFPTFPDHRAESREPRAESREPRAESREPRAESREPRAESREPRAESREPRAESREPRAESREPRAESREPRAESREPRAESREPRAESREPRAESREPRAESREPRAESREPRAESREPRAESREPRAESREPSRAARPAGIPGLAVWLLASLCLFTVGTTRAQTTPDAPASFVADGGDTLVRLTWSAPSSDGGAPITKYQYRYSAGTAVASGAVWTDVPDIDEDGDAADETAYRVTGLVNGTGYAFELRAVNSQGGGAPGSDTATPVAQACTVPDLGTRRTVWSGTVTVVFVPLSGQPSYGYFSGDQTYGSISEEQFSIGANTYDISLSYVETAPTAGQLTFGLDKSLAAEERAALKLHVCGDANGLALSEATEVLIFGLGTGEYEWATAGLDWSLSRTRNLRLSLPANNPPQGRPAISGTAVLTHPLTASTDAITDADGLGTFTYQWMRVDADGVSNPVNVGTNANTYTPVAADVGKRLKVEVRFTDKLGASETVTSEPYPETGMVTTVSVAEVTVTSTPAWSTDTYGAREHVEFSVRFTAPMAVTGHPTFGFTLGSGARQATYFAGSGTDTLLFSYAVRGGTNPDEDADGVSWAANRLALDGGAIVSVTRALPARLTHAAQSDLPGHKVDGSNAVAAATVTSVAVTSTPPLTALGVADTYGLGDTIAITVSVSAAVTVLGDPEFEFSLNDAGAPARPVRAAYNAAASTSTTLVFHYTVQVGDSDDDGISIGDHSTTFRLDADDRIRTADGKVDVDLSHTARGIQARHRVDASQSVSCLAPDLSQRRRVWSGKVTVGGWQLTTPGDVVGHPTQFVRGFSSFRGSLDNPTFDLTGRRYTIAAIYYGTQTRLLQFHLLKQLIPNERSLTTETKRALTLHVCNRPFALNDTKVALIGQTVTNLAAFAYVWRGFSPALDWPVGASIFMHLSLPPNHDATGAPEISGTAQPGRTLTADVSGIVDADGLPGASGFHYQWLRVNQDVSSNPTEIPGATSKTYDLTGDDLGRKLKVRVSFTDRLGGEEMRTSGPYPADGQVQAVAPGAPESFAVTTGNGQVALSWAPPASDGGSPVTKYQVRYSEGASVDPNAPTSAWADVPDGPDPGGGRDDETAFTVSSLVNGTRYAFEVRAVNAIGGGPAAGPETATPAAANTPPTLAYPIPDRTATEAVAFGYAFPPDTFNDTDGDTLAYTATRSNGSRLPAWLSFDAPARAFSGTPGPGDVGTLRVRVTARDGRGGSVSDIFDIAVSAAPTAPGAPRTFTATPGDAQVVLAWTAPASDGGAPVTRYQVRRAQGSTVPPETAWTDVPDGPDAGNDPGDETGHVFSLLDNGTQYAFEVRAVNAVGEGPPAGPRTATPAAGIAPNNPPTLAAPIPDQSATVGTAFRFAFSSDTFDDVDGDVLAYTASRADDSALPAWLVFDPGSRAFSGTPGPGDVGRLPVKVAASDGRGGSVSDDFGILVSAATAAPIPSKLPIASIIVEDDTVTVTFTKKLDSASNPARDHFWLGAAERFPGPGAYPNGPGVISVALDADASTAVLRISPVLAGWDVRLSYDPAITKSTGSHRYDLSQTPVRFADKSELDAFTNVEATNITPDRRAPRPIADKITVDGRILTMFFDEALDPAYVPDTDEFEVELREVYDRGGSRIDVQWVRISGDEVRLTLAEPVPPDRLVYLNYWLDADEGAVPFRDLAGNEHRGGTRYGVDNVTKTAQPSGVTLEVNGDRLTMTFAKALAASSRPAYYHFGLVNGSSVTAAAVDADAGTVTLTLLNPVRAGAAVRLNYDPAIMGDDRKDRDPNATPIRFSDGTKLAAFRNADVRNETPDTTPPRLLPDLLWVDGATLKMTFNESLDETSVPAKEEFEIQLKWDHRSYGYVGVESVRIDGAEVTLTLSKAAPGNRLVYLNYFIEKPVAAFKDLAGNEHRGGSRYLVDNRRRSGHSPVEEDDNDATAKGDRGDGNTARGTDGEVAAAQSSEAGGQNGPPLTASLSRTSTVFPHQGPGAGTFWVDLHFSEAPAGLDAATVGDYLIRVTAGQLATAERRSATHYRLWVRPAGEGAVTVRLAAASGCGSKASVCTTDGRALSRSVSFTVPGRVEVSVADARVAEGAGAALEFVVTLSRGTESLLVWYATSDGTATAGEDYTAASGELFFAPGVTSRTVSVTVLDDALDEGSETMRLRLTDVTDEGRIVDGEATGTIENTDPMPKAWLARLGRTVGSQVVEAVSARVDGGAAAAHLNVGGVSLLGGTPFDPDTTAHLTPQDWLASQMAGEPGAATRLQERTLTARDLLLGSSFNLVSQAGEDGGAAWSAWGRVSTGSFSAEADSVAMDGEVVTGLLGFDAEWERLLAGVLLLRSEGDGGYDQLDGDDSGTMESTLTGVYPYARLRLGGNLSVWAAAGAGAGDLRLVNGADVYNPGLDVRLGALGVWGALPAVGGLALAVKSDVLWVRTASDAVSGRLAATSAGVNRLRLILDGGRPWTLSSGAVLAPTVQIGLRHDGGDAETGTGVEVGAGLRYSAGILSIDAQVRTLLAHEAGSYEEWGASGSIRLSPNASGLGPSVAVLPSWGTPGSGVGQLWSSPDASALIRGSGPGSPPGRVDAELAWGLAALRGRGVLTPYARLALAENESRSWHIGTRLALAESLNVSLEGSHRQLAGSGTTHDLALRATVPW